jgi:N-acetylmuramoyl-L-alanine amidase
MGKNQPKYIIIHHSLTRDGSAKDWDAICRYHVEQNGWSKVGYHIGIEEVAGNLLVFRGRLDEEVGAHTREMGMNRRSIGICMVGNFDSAPPPPSAFEVLVSECRKIMGRYEIPAQNVLGHREVGEMAGFDWRKGQYKSCPGKHFNMDLLREMVGARLEYAI